MKDQYILTYTNSITIQSIRDYKALQITYMDYSQFKIVKMDL